MTPTDAAMLSEKHLDPNIPSLEGITRNRDLWCKVAGERLGEIGRLKESLDAMRRERDEARGEATFATATGGGGELARLRAERDSERASLARSLVEKEALLEEDFRRQEETERLEAELAKVRSHRSRLDAELAEAVGLCNDALEAARKASEARDEAVKSVEWLSDEVRRLSDDGPGSARLAMRERDEAVAELDRVRREIVLTVAERDASRAAFGALALILRRHVKMQAGDNGEGEDGLDSDDDLDSSYDSAMPTQTISLRIFVQDIKGEGIPGARITVAEGYQTLGSGTSDADGRFDIVIPLDPDDRCEDDARSGGGNDARSGGTSSLPPDFRPATTLDLASLGSRLDMLAGRLDAMADGVRDLDRFKDEHSPRFNDETRRLDAVVCQVGGMGDIFERMGDKLAEWDQRSNRDQESNSRRIAMLEALVRNLGQEVDCVTAKFDHPKLVALLRPNAGEPASWASNIRTKSEATAP